MKKMMLILAILTSTLSAFAKDVTVNQKVLDAFKTEFATAKEVNWTTTASYYKAEFTFSGQHVSAFYSTEGELLGITRYITSLDLPMNLQASLKKSYGNYWITDLMEVTKSDSTGYYITLENADTNIVLKATAGSEWSVYKKVKKI